MEFLPENIDHIIEQYLLGELSEGEVLKFEKRLTQDEALQTALEQAQLIHAVVIESEIEELRTALKEKLNPKKTPQKHQWLIWAAAGLIGLGSLFFIQTSGDQDESENQDEVVPAVQPIEKEEDRSLVPEALEDISVDIVSHEMSPPENEREEIGRDVQIDEVSTDSIAVNSSIRTDADSVENTVDEATDQNRHINVDTASEVVTVSNCPDKGLELNVTTAEDCEDGETIGSILVDVTNSEGPCFIYLDDDQVHKNELYRLSPGFYEVQMRKDDKCVSDVHEVEIHTLTCQVDVVNNIDVALSLSMSQTWEVPSSNSSGHVRIYNRNMVEVYNVFVGSNERHEWDGRDKTGAFLAIGGYVVVIEYTDGTQRTGTIDILE
jgi:hypothetical protein